MNRGVFEIVFAFIVKEEEEEWDGWMLYSNREQKCLRYK